LFLALEKNQLWFAKYSGLLFIIIRPRFLIFKAWKKNPRPTKIFFQAYKKYFPSLQKYFFRPMLFCYQVNIFGFSGNDL
jgi:hypothetical protein